MRGMLDVHTHILPCMDDGSRSAEQSLQMLREEARQGVDAVVLTPHFYANRESPERFLSRRSESIAALMAAAAGQSGLPVMYAGAEVAYYDGMSRSEQLEQLCIGNTGAMLVEMPFCEWNKRMLGELAELRDLRGIQPILAHVERYLAFQAGDIVSQLCGEGFWIQVNASFLTRWRTSRMAMEMLDQREIHFIGTDCHDMSQRSPNYGGAAEKIRRKLGEDALEHLQRMRECLLGGTR